MARNLHMPENSTKRTRKILAFTWWNVGTCRFRSVHPLSAELGFSSICRFHALHLHETCICSKNSKTPKDSSIYVVERWHLPKLRSFFLLRSFKVFEHMHVSCHPPTEVMSFSSICRFRATHALTKRGQETTNANFTTLLGGTF